MKRVLKPELKLGAEPKKVAALLVLIVGAVIAYIWNSSSPSNSPSPSSATTAARPLPATAPVPVAGRGSVRPPTRASIARTGSQGNRGSALQEFRPTLKPKDPIDPSRVDPTLHLELLAKLKNVTIGGGGRTLFDFASAPAPKVEIAKVGPVVPGHVASPFIGPIDKKDPPPPPPPPPAPIPLKFYGFTNTLNAGKKRAFFLEGEDIFVAGEGDMIKNRYKVVRIGINSAEVEDTTNKNKQTLPLEAEQVNT